MADFSPDEFLVNILLEIVKLKITIYKWLFWKIMPPETKKKERAFPVEACPPGGRTFGFMAAENQKKKKATS